MGVIGRHEYRQAGLRLLLFRYCLERQGTCEFPRSMEQIVAELRTELEY